MCVSEARNETAPIPMARYNFSLLFESFSEHVRVQRELEIFAKLCTRGVARANRWIVIKAPTQQLDHLELDFQHFYSPTFSLHAEMKVNSCRWCMQIESWRCFYWLIFCIKLHVGAFNSCPKLAAANQRMSIWIMRRMNCQFHVRRQFVHWQFMEFVTERKKSENVKCHWRC